MFSCGFASGIIKVFDLEKTEILYECKPFQSSVTNLQYIQKDKFLIFLNSVLSSLSCDSLFILSKCFSFVKNFFKLFYVEDKAEKEGFEPSRQFPDLYP